MDMILMHKDIPVADIVFSSFGTILNIKGIYNYEHMPVGTRLNNSALYVNAMNRWFKNRMIPSARENADKIVNVIDGSIGDAIIKNRAVSLTDCYWLKGYDENLTWKDVNYYDNGFSSNIFENAVLNKGVDIDYNSPDFATDGALEKYWIMLDGKPTLLKYGDFMNVTKGNNILSANEVIASKIADIMQIPHAEYFPYHIENSDQVICASPCMVSDSNTELVNGGQIEREALSTEQITLDKKLKILEFDDYVNMMKIFDLIIVNNDRHDRNFAFIRNPDTLEYIAPTPIYDSGSSLGWDGEWNIEKVDFRSIERDMQKNISELDLTNIIIPDIQEVCEIIDNVYEEFKISREDANIAKAAIKSSINLLLK